MFCVEWRSARMLIAFMLIIDMINVYMKTDYFCHMDPVKV